ncbi:MAG: acyl carrier protein [Clostridia bacterium]|nr:acyl carrier protein [Clostridia bacterium]
MMIYERIKEVLIKHAGVESDKITMEARFVEDLNIDSLDLVDLIIMLEEEYNIEFDEDAADHIKTIADVVDYINKNA